MNTLINRKKYHYFKNKFKDCKNSGEFWKPVNNLLGHNKVKHATPNAEALANFFQSSPMAARSSIPSWTSRFTDSLRNRNYLCFNFNVISEGNVTNIVKTLDCKETYGLDTITNELITLVIHYICSPVTYLYNLIIKSGEYPIGWKISKVTALFKNGIKAKLKIINRFLFFHVYPKFSNT